jgi:transposase
MKEQSEEIRALAVAAHRAGQSPHLLAEIFQVTSRTIYRWTKEAEAGQTAGRKRGCRPHCLTAEDLRRLDDLAREHPGKSLAALREALGNQCSLPTILRALVQLGHRDRKNAARRRAKSSRGGVRLVGDTRGAAEKLSNL